MARVNFKLSIININKMLLSSLRVRSDYSTFMLLNTENSKVDDLLEYVFIVNLSAEYDTGTQHTFVPRSQSLSGASSITDLF